MDTVLAQQFNEQFTVTYTLDGVEHVRDVEGWQELANILGALYQWLLDNLDITNVTVTKKGTI